MCKVMACWAIFCGLGLLFYLLTGTMVDDLRYRVEGLGFRV